MRLCPFISGSVVFALSMILGSAAVGDDRAEARKVIDKAIQNYAFDTAQDHSAVLRKIWGTLTCEQSKARYQCLLAMEIQFQFGALTRT